MLDPAGTWAVLALAPDPMATVPIRNSAAKAAASSRITGSPRRADLFRSLSLGPPIRDPTTLRRPLPALQSFGANWSAVRLDRSRLHA